MRRIVVLGSANTDLIVRVPRIPAPGETVLGSDLVRAPGGKGANQAVAAARLGAQVTFIGCIGTDDLGDAYLANLKAEGLDLSYVRRDSQRPSGVALIFVSSDGENAIAVAPGANSAVHPHQVRDAEPAISEADCVVAQLEVPLEAVCCAAELCVHHNVPFVLNPAPAPRQALPASLLSQTAVLVPNIHEAAAIVGRNGPPKELAQALLSMGPASVAMTLGPNGALVAEPGSAPALVPGMRVRAVDATAAGDCFTAALAVALSEGQILRDAVAFANAAAALSVTKLGAQPSLPTRAELEAFLREAPQ
ncbi:MAG: ribokinase [Armatimonadota bacterium]